MTSIKFEITWEDVRDVAKQRNGQTLSKEVACFLLADIESGVRGWFNETKGDSICDALQVSGTLWDLDFMQRVEAQNYENKK